MPLPVQRHVFEPSMLSGVTQMFIGALTDDNLSAYSSEVYQDFRAALVDNSALLFAVVDIDEPASGKSRQDRATVVVEKKWIIANDFKKIDYGFFRFIGSKINEVLTRKTCLTRRCDQHRITWSFPLDTTSYNNGKIRHVSKGYTIGDDIYDQT
ncbi:N-acetylglucosamine kinase 1 [Candida viswanathii]|uniref:N-acetylglucosamine kinase 1 n=1 Tax=Candida viswanathii TaxID=5486 RepID=A0A367YDU2_9ASCO|nr:N-acetylglucosamine kinase 1 [Candida viswanathii]